MSQNPNNAKNFGKNYSRKDNTIYNTKGNRRWRYKYNNIKIGDKKQTTVKYKRRNIEYDAFIPYNSMEEDEIKWNLGKNRSNNYTNEAESSLYDVGNTKFVNVYKEKYINETNESKYNNKDNSKNEIIKDKFLEDMKIINMKKINDINNKSENGRNSNRNNHNYHESYYSNELLNKLNIKFATLKIEITLTIINSQIETKDALLKSQQVLESISKSMKTLVNGQNELIQLTKKNIKK